VSEQPSYQDVLHALRVRLAGNPRLRDMPAGDIASLLLNNAEMPTNPDPELITRALEELREEES
jgi:hypothetical protein